MNGAETIPQKQVIGEACIYPAIDEYEQLKGMVVKWLEEYRKLEPMIQELCSRAGDER
jgi:hypothetical protein